MAERDNIDRIVDFNLYWDTHLSKRLKNAELMAKYPNKNLCKNEILNELINSYINGAIESALLMFYEAVKFIRKTDSSFRYQEIESDPVGIVMAYRNKLLTHREENRYSEAGQQFSTLLQNGQRNVYRDIEVGVSKVKDWLDTQDLGGRSSASKAHIEINLHDFEELIKSAPTFNPNE